jgi:hypothetical protein
MEYQTYRDVVDMSWDMTLGLVVLTLYIVGKVWMYYKVNEPNPKEKQKKGVIKRGNEWPE